MFRNNRSSLPCKFIVFEGDFYTYLSGFAARDIKPLCDWIATESIYHLYFDAYLLYKKCFSTY